MCCARDKKRDKLSISRSEEQAYANLDLWDRLGYTYEVPLSGIVINPEDRSLDATLGPASIRLRGVSIVGETAVYRFPRRRPVRQSHRLRVRTNRFHRRRNQSVLTLNLRVHRRFVSSGIRGLVVARL